MSKNRPHITWVITLAVACSSVLAFIHLKETVQILGFIPDLWTRYFGLTLITSFFIHAGLMHLVGNLYFLIVFGSRVEDFLGKKNFLALILLSTVIGGIAHALLDPRKSQACIGASGGISGVIVFYCLAFPYAKLGMFIWYFYYGRWFTMPAFFALFIWVIYQFAMIFMQIGGYSNVSALAHIGGALTGILFWIYFRKLDNSSSVQETRLG